MKFMADMNIGFRLESNVVAVAIIDDNNGSSSNVRTKNMWIWC